MFYRRIWRNTRWFCENVTEMAKYHENGKKPFETSLEPLGNPFGTEFKVIGLFGENGFWVFFLDSGRVLCPE